MNQQSQRMNILAARAVAEAVKSTLGPKGMDKMLVDGSKEVVLTSSGAAILSAIGIKHPAAKMIAEVAKTQKKEVGDGTTSAVVLAGELLKKAEELLDQGIHAAHIVQGYRSAGEKAVEILNSIGIEIAEKDLKNIASTILMGKLGDKEREHIVNIAVGAIKAAKEKDNILLEYRSGGKLSDAELINGIMIDLGKRLHPAMPKKVRNARILLVDREFEVKKVEHAKIDITDPKNLRAFAEYKEKILKIAADMVAGAGANVLFCQKNIDELAMFYLAKAGILGVRDVDKDVLEKLAKATGAKIVSNVKEVTPSVLGYAGLVEETKIGPEEIMYIRECRNPGAVGILIRGVEKGAVELKKRIEDLLSALERTLKDKKVIAGGGAAEVEISRRLREYAREMPGKGQLAVEAYAGALEVIPKVVAANAGLNPVDILVRMRAEHENGGLKSCLDVRDGKIKDAYAAGIVEPLRVKSQAIKSATEVANMILRIDDVLIAKGFGKEKAAEVPAAPPREDVTDFPAKKGRIDFTQMRAGL